MTAKLLTESKMMGSLYFNEQLKNKDADKDKLLAKLLKAELEWRSQK